MLVNGKKITTIIFDWSGTLSDDRRMVFEANMLIRREHDLPLDDFDSFLATIKGTAPEAFADLGIPGTVDKLQALYIEALNRVKEQGSHPVAYEDAKAALSHLSASGVRTAVLSSHPEKHVRSEASVFRLEKRFHHIAGDVQDKTVGIWESLEKMEIDDRSSVVYIGDTIYDIQAAKLAGVVSAGITTGYMNAVRLMMEDPDLLFYSLTDVAKQY